LTGHPYDEDWDCVLVPSSLRERVHWVETFRKHFLASFNQVTFIIFQLLALFISHNEEEKCLILAFKQRVSII
jgi:hypothetical protein